MQASHETGSRRLRLLPPLSSKKQSVPFAIPKAPVAKTQAKAKQQAAPKQQTASKQKPAAKPKQPAISSPSGYENGHGYVDLGLSVKWATMNVGASSATDYGDYYAWGETRTKGDYSWSTYFDTNDGGNTFFKYATNKKTTLDLSDDAAHANWGGSWRMPTRAEQDELSEKCTWTWSTQNGVKGYKVSSKHNGNSIFLPAAGFRNDSSRSYGNYWSSSLFTSYSNYGYGLYLSSHDVGFSSHRVGWFYFSRYDGLSVRAVCP